MFTPYFPDEKQFFNKYFKLTENHGESNGNSSIISRRTRQRG